jgi:hypothetical protein
MITVVVIMVATPVIAVCNIVRDITAGVSAVTDAVAALGFPVSGALGALALTDLGAVGAPILAIRSRIATRLAATARPFARFCKVHGNKRSNCDSRQARRDNARGTSPFTKKQHGSILLPGG